MSLFSAVGQGLSGVFSGLYPDGQFHKVAQTRANNGDVTAATTDHDCKAKVDQATEAMKSDEGYATTDVAIYVLKADSLPVITTDDQITAEGTRYRIQGPIRTDTAGSHYILRARP